jgi:epoxyqueuosine reductase
MTTEQVMSSLPPLPPLTQDLPALVDRIKAWGKELGFGEVRITDVDLSHAQQGYLEWLAAGYHGEMEYMAAHGSKRYRPDELVPGTVRAIMARMDYLPAGSDGSDGRHGSSDWREQERTHGADTAVISVYARGRDYHKVLRNRLQQLADRIRQEIGDFGYRVFTDSAPVMEVALAEKAGLGWRGKHTLLLSREAGSMFFLGEILVDIPLPVDAPVGNHCGQCTSCMDVCPTKAIVAPYTVDARRCISYLTIELHGSIPQELRPLIGNRVYGCDDCQLFCPWNKFAQASGVDDFNVRHGLDGASMLSLFAWNEAEFMQRMEGSPIRRIGYERWLRNLAVGLGNAAGTDGGRLCGDMQMVAALEARLQHPSELVREHVRWALEQHGKAAVDWN